jgi:hypothetical protein
MTGLPWKIAVSQVSHELFSPNNTSSSDKVLAPPSLAYNPLAHRNPSLGSQG